MDIVGVPEVAAEAELISAIATFLEVVGLGPGDVAIKVSSRKVLQAVLERYSIPAESFGPVCVVIDKLDKLPAEKVGRPPECGSSYMNLAMHGLAHEKQFEEASMMTHPRYNCRALNSSSYVGLSPYFPTALCTQHLDKLPPNLTPAESSGHR